jgi:CHAT domain-containing protein
MSTQRHQTLLPGHNGPYFPGTLDRLARVLEEYQIDRYTLESAARAVGGFLGEEFTTTSDGYSWFAGLRFAVSQPHSPGGQEEAGQIVILIPWSQDFARQDGTSTDRSIAIYTTNDNGLSAAAQLIQDYAEAIAGLLDPPAPAGIPDTPADGHSLNDGDLFADLDMSASDSALQAANEYAVGLVQAGRFEAALSVTSRLHAVAAERYGRIDERTHAVTMTLFELLLITGEPAAAAQVIETARADYSRLQPSDPGRLAVEERASAMRAMREFQAARPEWAQALPVVRVPPDVTGEIARKASLAVVFWYKLEFPQAVSRFEAAISDFMAAPGYDLHASYSLLAVFVAMKLQARETTQDELRLLVEVLTEAISESASNDIDDAAAALAGCRELVLVQILRMPPAQLETTLDEEQRAAETAASDAFYSGQYRPSLQQAKSMAGNSPRDRDFFAMVEGLQQSEKGGGSLDQLEAAAAAAGRLHADQSFGELTERITLPFRLVLFTRLLQRRPSQPAASALVEAAEDALDCDFSDAAELDQVLDAVSKATNRLCQTDPAYRPDLDRLVKIRHRVLAKSSPESGSKQQRLHALTLTLDQRYELRGDMADLDEFIARGEELRASYPDSPRAGAHLEALGGGYLRRYDRLGVPQDLERAISSLNDATLRRSSGQNSRASTLIMLGSAYLQRASMLEGSIVSSAIDAAQAFLERADAPDGGRAQPPKEKIASSLDLVSDLGEPFRQAANAFSAAGAAAPGGSEVRIWSLVKYAELLLRKFGIDGQRNDVETALAIARSAAAEFTGNGLLAVFCHQIAARALKHLHGTGQSADYADAGTAEFRAACLAAVPLSALVVLDVTTEWAGWAFGRASWAEAAEAMTHLVDAFEVLYQAQSLRDTFASVYRRLPGLAGRLHYAMVRCERPEAAVELLERCRALQLMEMTLRDQGVLEELRRSGYETEVVNYLARASDVRALELGSSLSVPVAAGPDVDQVRQARHALDEATAVIRGLPGMRNFHERLSLADLRELARTEPVVYLSSSPAGGCASVVKDHTVTSVTLPGLHDDAVREMAGPWITAGAGSAGQAAGRGFAPHVRHLLPWLRQAAMSALADALGDTRAVTIIPTGLLVLFPLHAACLEPADGKPESDLDLTGRLIMRYSPTAAMAAVARDAAHGRSDHSIMTILGSGPGLTTARFEVSEARRLFAEQREIDCSAEPDPVGAVLRRAGESDVLHIACHARSSAEVLDSRLWLTGTSSVTLRQIRVMSGSVRLAVLSACETSISETTSPDEVVNFCTGLLATGTGGCVGSLWRVPDESTSLLMAKFYREWKEGGRTPLESLTSAQSWLRAATNRTLNSFLPQVRTRPPGLSAAALSFWEGAQPFSDPYYWAGFVYVGA